MQRALLIATLLLIPSLASAHGAIQKIAGGKYLLNLSSAPLAPEAGQEQQDILAISTVADDSLVAKNVVFHVEIHKDDKPIFTADNLVATGGLLPFKYTYPTPGLYEFFATFKVPGDATVYEPEDIWVQVIEPQAAATTSKGALPLGLGGLVAGIVIGLLAGRMIARPRHT